MENDFDRYAAEAWCRLLRSAWLLTGDWHLAEDLLQTALVKTARRWGRVAGGSPDAYVRRVLVTTYLSWWRRRWRAEWPTSSPPEPVGRGTDALEAAELRCELAAALATLPRQQRAVLMLRFHADLTEAQTADVLGVAVGTVKSYTARALSTLRQREELRGLMTMERDS